MDAIERKTVSYNKNECIHSNKEINSCIHQIINDPPKEIIHYQTQLTLIYSNGNAILNPIQYTVNISSLNYFILLAINRLENNPGLLFINNSYTTKDFINCILSDIDIQFDQKEKT